MARGGQQLIPRPATWRLGEAAPWQGAPPPTMAQLLDAVRNRPITPIIPTFPDARPAAVLAVLHDAPGGPEVLLTKRAAHLRHHRGEISFPGGRVEPGESPVETALREAHEEVALDPARVEVHGELDHLATIVSQSYIVPVVASVRERPVLAPQETEVDRILWVPVAELVATGTHREERWGTPPLDRPIHFFDLDDETIWGATGRMLHQLLSLVYGPPATRTAAK